MKSAYVRLRERARRHSKRASTRRIVAALIVFVIAQTAPASNLAVNGFDYFPLTPGSTYLYQYSQVQAANPITSSLVTVYGGINFNDRNNTTLFEWKHSCASGSTCTSLSRFYYSTDPTTGVLLLGVYNVASSGKQVTVTYTQPELFFKPSIVPGTLSSGGTGIVYVGADLWGGQRVGNSTLTGALDGTYYYVARQLLTSMQVPAGVFANILYVYSVDGGYERESWYAPGVGLIRWKDQVQDAQLASYYIPSPASTTATAVEYYHSGLDHYFITALQSEITKLDQGAFIGWTRTGYSFKVIDASSPTPIGASTVCRYYGNPAHGLDSHFYSASPAECATVHEKWPEQWQLESNNVYQVYLPDTSTGTCPANTQPIYRTWNNRPDTNHRYAVDAQVQTQMLAKGWIAEGYGNPPVVMCAPL